MKFGGILFNGIKLNACSYECQVRIPSVPLSEVGKLMLRKNRHSKRPITFLITRVEIVLTNELFEVTKALLK